MLTKGSKRRGGARLERVAVPMWGAGRLAGRRLAAKGGQGRSSPHPFRGPRGWISTLVPLVGRPTVSRRLSGRSARRSRWHSALKAEGPFRAGRGGRRKHRHPPPRSRVPPQVVPPRPALPRLGRARRSSDRGTRAVTERDAVQREANGTGFPFLRTEGRPGFYTGSPTRLTSEASREGTLTLVSGGTCGSGVR